MSKWDLVSTRERLKSPWVLVIVVLENWNQKEKEKDGDLIVWTQLNDAFSYGDGTQTKNWVLRTNPEFPCRYWWQVQNSHVNLQSRARIFIRVLKKDHSPTGSTAPTWMYLGPPMIVWHVKGLHILNWKNRSGGLEWNEFYFLNHSCCSCLSIYIPEFLNWIETPCWGKRVGC